MAHKIVDRRSANTLKNIRSSVANPPHWPSSITGDGCQLILSRVETLQLESSANELYLSRRAAVLRRRALRRIKPVASPWS